MRRERLSRLLLLRYRLQWAYVRRSPGNIARFAVAQFLIVLGGLLSGAAGVGLPLVAINLGGLEAMMRAALGGTFGSALAASVLLGFGTRAAFSDATLRRYPLSTRERFAARQLLGLFEPLWLSVGAVYLGCAVGIGLVGTAPLWRTVPCAILLGIANYLLAGLMLSIVSRAMATRSGSFLLAVAMHGFIFVVFGVKALALRNDVLASAVELAPPMIAAEMMTARPTRAVSAVALALWCAGLAAALLFVEARGVPAPGRPSRSPRWGEAWNRLASLVPGVPAPLGTRALRYYLRNVRVQLGLALSLPFALFLIHGVEAPQEAPLLQAFERALLFIPLTGALTTAGLSLNAFGAEGSGFRRLLVSPCSQVALVRATAAAPVVIGGVYSGVVVPAWMLISRMPIDGRLLLMLLAQSFTVLLLFQALAVWSSVLSPRRLTYGQRFRDEMSAGGYVALIGGCFVALILPVVLRGVVMPGPIVQYWWAPLAALPAAVAVWELTCRSAARAFARRRERVLAVVEGRQ